MKKAQVTAFIILGLIILFFIFAFYSVDHIREDTEKEVVETLIASDVVAIKNFVNSCIKQTASDGLLLIGVQGGYTYIVPLSFPTPKFNIGFAYFDSANILISLEDIGKGLSNFVVDQISSCTQDFTPFEQQGYSISWENIEAQTIFTEDSTIVKLNWPLQIRKGETQSTISDFSASVPVRIKKIYEVVETIVNKQKEDPEFVDFSYLKNTGFIVMIQPVNEDVIIYTILDNESKIFNNPYFFSFANKFKFSDFKIGINPVIGFIPSVNATVGNEFTYQVKASDIDSSNLTFSSIGNLIKIDKETGLIRFTPTLDQIGVHFAVIEVQDDSGLTDSTLFRVEVIENV